jgi:TonB family protein
MSRPLFEFITQPEKLEISRGRRAIVLLAVIVFHIVALYFLLTARYHIKFLKLGGTVQTVVLVPPVTMATPPNQRTPLVFEPGGARGEDASAMPPAGGAPSAAGGQRGASRARAQSQGQPAVRGDAVRGQDSGALAPGAASPFVLRIPVKPGLLTGKEPEGVTGGVGGSYTPPRRSTKMRSYTLTDYWGRRLGLSPEPGSEDSPGGPLGSPHALVRSSTGDKVIYRGNASPNVQGFDISPWAQLLVNIIQRNWVLPPADAAKASGRVGITIIVDGGGQLSTVRLINSSSNQLLDRAALDAIARSLPFPRLPPGFPDRQLEAYLLFDYHEKK